MPFDFQPYRSPFTNSIAELMLRRGDAAARSAEQIGAIQGNAAQQSGQAWAQGLMGATQAVAGIPQQIETAKRNATIDETNALRLKETKDAIAEHDTFKKILRDTPPVNENGMQLYDLPSLASKATAAGIDPSAYLEHYSNVNNGFRNEFQARMATVQAGAQGLMLAPDPVLAKDFLDRLAANNTISSAVHQHLSQLIEADPTPANIARLVAPFAGPQKPIMGKQGETPLNPITARPMGPSLPDKNVVVPQGGTLVGQQPGGAPSALFTSPPAPTTAGNEAAIRALYAKRESGQPLTPAEVAQIKGYEAEKSFNDAPVTVKTMENGRPVEKVMTRAQALAAGSFTSQPPASVTINNERMKGLDLPTWATDASRPAGAEANQLDPTIRMTPNGLHQAALNYIANGQFPPTGRGTDPIAVAQRAAITSKVGAIAADSGMDEPALRAFYKSNSSSLTQQQKSLDTVQGFMATADRNADLLKKTLEKIPDTGSPLLNVPLRSVDQKALGNVNLSQFRTYVQSVQNEYARIISQPNLSGQLTDSARKEAEQLIDPNATVAQIIGSVEALRNEGANRLLSIGEQIQRIQQRMTVTPGGGGPKTTTPKNDPLGLFGGKTP